MTRHRLGRKGVGELVDWIWPMLFMIIAIVVIVMLVRSYESRTIDSAPLEMEAFAARLLNDPDILVYQDAATGRAYPNVLDAKKITGTKLDEVFTQRTESGVSLLSARVNITPGDACATPATEIYLDKKTFDERFPIARRKLLGPGGATTRAVTYPVTIMDGDKRCTARMTITMVRVNA